MVLSSYENSRPKITKIMDIKKIIIENAYEFEKDRFIIGLGNIDQIITEIYQALQLLQPDVIARFNIPEDELIKELEDKRICKLSDLPEDIYYLHRKETARWLLEKYDIFKK